MVKWDCEGLTWGGVTVLVTPVAEAGEQHHVRVVLAVDGAQVGLVPLVHVEAVQKRRRG